ncbi:MAG: SMP-30/gluconolactonase/LRE family protein [Methylobacterium sp.]|jgi:gluconolactonase|nr:SMP-30/gluconolactonase/LRE family protein [Methylobacterium sp.]
MSVVRIHDPRFARLMIGHANLEKLWTGGRWLEGPAYFPAGRYLVFSDIPNDRLLRFDEMSGQVSVFWPGCGFHNGHARDQQGRLVCCEHLARVVSRIEHDGSRRVLASHWQGKRFNSPNDVIVAPDGAIWFSDPTYGIDGDYEGEKAESEIGASNVYRLDPETGAVEAVVTDRVKPNGLALAPGGQFLVVADTGRTHRPELDATLTRYRLDAEGRPIQPGETFATLADGFFDGFRFDAEGNLWSSAGRFVHCHGPDGALGLTIEIGEIVGNLCFGGSKGNRLFICAQTSLYSLFVNARGAT